MTGDTADDRAEGVLVVWRRAGRGTDATPETDEAREGDGLLGDPRLARAVLDSAPANLFVADPQLNLVYMNPKAATTLRGLGGELQRAFGVGFSQVLGGGIHRFHKHPQRVERILRTPGQLPHDTTFTIGSVTLDTHIDRVTGPDGALVGYVVAWEDSTERRAAEGKAGTLAARLVETQEVSAGMQAVAAAIEEMAATASEIARNATEANTTVSTAVTVVRSANQTMTDLGAASEQISDVVKAIGAVAEQTNLLALNATIEAARAGESGKGFAVVAGEVKELSKQTKEATERINTMISSVQQLSRAAIEAIGGLAEVMEQVSQNQASIASAVEEQTATTQEISASVARAARRAEEIASSVAALH
jgi:predicted  nucleic acid-binding Zn-ribbon protein